MFDTIKFFAKAAVADRKGVTALEYGVIAAAIIAACVVMFNTIGTKLKDMLTTLNGSL